MPPTEPNPASSSSPAPRNSGALVVASLVLLAILVWALHPRKPRLTPAPLTSRAAGCPPLRGGFTPSDITELPGLPLDHMASAVKNRVLYRLNMEPCSCGCGQSIAACRLNQPECPTSARLVRSVVGENQRSAP